MSSVNNTLTYSEPVAGWTSFYSYEPDWMIGMNNFFYTFSNGNLYRHNTNETRNEFYGVQYNSTLQSVFNDVPLENKLFKTLNIEGDAAWHATIATDIQDSGYIEKKWFEKKEGSWYSFIRNSGSTPASTNEYALRSLNGIGNSLSVSPIVGGEVTIDYSLNINLGNIVSIGDMLYFIDPLISTDPQFAGQIIKVNVNLQSGQNQFVVNTVIPALPDPPVTIPITSQTAYYLYVKNAVAESHGVLGHYAVFDLTNDSSSKVELFAIESEIMKSFP